MPASAAEDLGQQDRLSRRATTRTGRLSKRFLDVLGAFFVLACVSPLILVLSILVKIQDGGPIFHRRRVVGPAGEFDAFKLRSMRVDADQVLAADPELRKEFEVNYKLKNDPRVTPI